MKRIICIGNQYLSEDKSGYEVYQNLSKRILPDDVEIIDGGIGGLNLLGYIDGMERIVFVDTISGFGSEGEIILLKSSEVAKLANPTFDHSAGLPFLLRIIPEVCDGPLPQILVLGIEGFPNKKTIKKASTQALNVVFTGKTGKECFYG